MGLMSIYDRILKVLNGLYKLLYWVLFIILGNDLRITGLKLKRMMIRSTDMVVSVNNI